MQKPSIGRVVLYVLTQTDVAAICYQRERRRSAGLMDAHDGLGNPVQKGDIVPAIIVRVWDESTGMMNGQALLDGPDSLWLMSRHRDDAGTPGTWHWPKIEPVKQDSISRMDAELSAGKWAGFVATMSQIELKARRLCAHIETLGASPELTHASVEASNIRSALEHIIEDRPIDYALRDWLEGLKES